jgi:ferritin-like metal-binding protein YciE
MAIGTIHAFVHDILPLLTEGDSMAETARDLFEHGLADMYDAEEKLVRALDRMAKNASNRELAKGFRAHARTTKKQARRLERVFRELGRKPRRHACAGINGLIEEYSTFSREEKPSDAALDVFATEAALKVEHYEIVAYHGLIKLAKQIRLEQAPGLLKETLAEEEETASLLEGLTKTLGQELSADEEDAP